MPHTSSAKKHLRKDEKRRLANRAIMRTLKTHIKKVFEFEAAGPLDQLAELARVAVKKLDKAAAKRVVHPNLAARKKSQLDHFVNTRKAAVSAKPPEAPPA